MGKDKKWMEETRAAWASLMQQRTLRRIWMAAAKPEKIRKQSEWEIPRRSATEQMEKREMTNIPTLSGRNSAMKS